MAVTVLSSGSMRGVFDALRAGFERAAGNPVAVAYDAAHLALARLKAGERVDVAILAAPAVDELVAMGAIDRGQRIEVARCAVGVAVRAGAPRPDVSTVDALKSALLAARSIAYTESGASGVYFAALIERLGIADAVRAKACTRPAGLIAELVANGVAELAVQQIPELLAVQGVDVIGPLPAELDHAVVLVAGVLKASPQQAAAQRLIDALSTGESARVMHALGLETLQLAERSPKLNKFDTPTKEAS